jgi:hypothetical protein
MTHFAREMRVFFVEEPLLGDEPTGPWLQLESTPNGVTIATPRIPHSHGEDHGIAVQRGLLVRLLHEEGIRRPILWYDTPMALAFTGGLPAAATVYDCMDELSAFAGARPRRTSGSGSSSAARTSSSRAAATFTRPSGRATRTSTLSRAASISPTSTAPASPSPSRRTRPGSRARASATTPCSTSGSTPGCWPPWPMPGQAGARPSWQFVLICPIVKIRADSLPQRPNLHYLGPKPYGELPAYLAGWDATFMPFALNEATRLISPTKTPEYLAAGRPVVSTPVRDVVREWGERGLVRIAATPEEAVAALEGALWTGAARSAWLRAVDRALAATSWDETFARMRALIP